MRGAIIRQSEKPVVNAATRQHYLAFHTEKELKDLENEFREWAILDCPECGTETPIQTPLTDRTTIACQECRATYGLTIQRIQSVEQLRKAIVELLGVKMEGDLLDTKSEMYDEGDEDAPFFSEAYLYNLLGKENARTVLAGLRQICEAAGLDMYDLEVEAEEAEKAEKRKRK